MRSVYSFLCIFIGIVCLNSNALELTAQNNQEKIKNIVIASSYRKFWDQICEAKDTFELSNILVLEPSCAKVLNPDAEFIVTKSDVELYGENTEIPIDLLVEKRYFESIEKSDALYIINPNGYIGLSTALEVGYGLGLGKKVYCQSMPKEHAHSIFCPKTTSVQEFIAISKGK